MLVSGELAGTESYGWLFVRSSEQWRVGEHVPGPVAVYNENAGLRNILLSALRVDDAGSINPKRIACRWECQC